MLYPLSYRGVARILTELSLDFFARYCCRTEFVVTALILSIPMSVYSSRIALGRGLRRAGLFVIPEEADAPQELRRLQTHLTRSASLPGFTQAVVDPFVHAVACASANTRRSQPDAVSEARQRLIEEARVGGPDALSKAQKAVLLGDPLTLSRLHFQVWTSAQAHPAWLGNTHAVERRSTPGMLAAAAA